MIGSGTIASLQNAEYNILPNSENNPQAQMRVRDRPKFSHERGVIIARH